MAEMRPDKQTEDPFERNNEYDYEMKAKKAPDAASSSQDPEASAADEDASGKPSAKKPTLKSWDAVQVPQGKTHFFDLEFNVAAALCYFPLLPIIAPILWLRTELNINEYLKWHCVQGIIFGGGFLALSVIIGTVEAILGFIPMIGPVLSMILILLRALLGVLFTVYAVRQMIDVYKGRPGRLPFVSNFTDQFMQAGKV